MMTPQEALQVIRLAVDQLRRGAYPTTEFDWFAVDAEGYVAVFANGGHLPVPLPILEHPESIFAVHSTVARFPPKSEIMPDDNSIFASKGLFVFDWSGRKVDQQNRRYTRTLVPTDPVKAEDMLEHLTDHDRLAVHELPDRFSAVSELII